MTDIVTRLRACHGIHSGDPECCCEEAAAEIERLRTDKVSIVVKAKDAEIERLRTRLAIQFGMHPGGDLAKATQAEIERLRATINTQSAAIERADRLVLACEQHLRDAKHEITKLRADLHENGIIR